MNSEHNAYALIGLGASVLGGFIGWYIAGGAGAAIGATIGYLALTLF